MGEANSAASMIVTPEETSHTDMTMCDNHQSGEINIIL